LLEHAQFKRSPYMVHAQLARIVAENIIAIDSKFWLRVATRSDTASGERVLRACLLACLHTHLNCTADVQLDACLSGGSGCMLPTL
jgi:hypothetical protein